MAMNNSHKYRISIQKRLSLFKTRFSKESKNSEENRRNLPPTREKRQRFYHLIRGKVLIIFLSLLLSIAQWVYYRI